VSNHAQKQTTTRRGLPLGAELQPTIDRLKAIAADAGDRLLLADGPVHPDAALLELCGEALHVRRRAEELLSEWHALPAPYGQPPATEAENRRRREVDAQHRECDTRVTQLLKRAKKIRATTPAGIYAKALLVRASRNGAAVLAMSLAEELIDCRKLRESLWPAAAVEA
jgi:hypothetical protein